ncbi:MAG TPA: MFS transporter [Reyranella sp.]|nr:MFS transporter [Reyranella sp.]
MTAASATLDSRAAWVVATAALVILSIAYGAPLLAAVALKPIAAEFGTARAAVAAAPSFTFVGAAFGGIAAGWLSGWLGIRRIVLFGAAMLAAGLVLSAAGGLFQLYAGHGVLMGLFGTSCMFSPIMTYVSRWFDRSRGAAVAMISSGQSLAGAFWPIVFQAGITEFGWRRTMLVFGLFVGATILVLAAIFLRPPPQPLPSKAGDGRDPKAGAPVLGLSPNLAMIILSVAIFCCCVPMAMPSQHIVAFCGDLGFASQIGAAMLSVLLGSAFVARQFWGWAADRIGGLQTLLWSSIAQATALSGFLLTKDEATLFVVSAAFGLGFSGLLPAYVIAIREYYPVKEANWRVPTIYFAGFLGMAAGGWGAGALYDHFGYYLPAFAVGIGFNIVNLVILLTLVFRQRDKGLRTAMA